MEGSRGPFFPSGHLHHHHHQPASSGSNLLGAANIAAHGGAPANPSQNQLPQPQQPEQRVMLREQDHYMPIANVIRIMRRILPSHAKISDEAKETVQECVSEYISFITSEANQRCQQEQRKTVTADDVLWAMEKLGFDDYVGPLSLYLHRYRNGDGNGGAGAGGHYVPRAQQVPAPELAAAAMPPPQPPSYYYGSGYNYPVAGPNLMGSGAGSSSGVGGGAPSYYDPYGPLRNDRF